MIFNIIDGGSPYFTEWLLAIIVGESEEGNKCLTKTIFTSSTADT